MNLSRKIILIIVSTFIALVFIVATTSDIILLNSFANLERKVLKNDVSKVVNEIEESFPELDSSARDFTVLFQHDVNAQISNLGIISFTNHRVDFVACYSQTGDLLSIKTSDFHNHRFAELTQSQLNALKQATRHFAARSDKKPLHGFVSMGSSVAQLALRSFDADRIILVGKFIDQEEVERVASLTKFTIEVSPFISNTSPPDFAQAATGLSNGSSFHSIVQDDAHIAGYSLFNDVYGNPVLMLKITEQRLIYQQGKVSISYILLALFVSGAVFCGVTLLFIRGSVLKRLASLSAKVGDISKHKDITERLEVKGDDELENLAGSINTMLNSLQSAEYALKESEERYRSLFERAPDSIIIIGMEGDEAGRIVAANGAAASQHGYSIEEICTLTIHDLNTPEADLMADVLFEQIGRGEWATCELWHRRKDGSRFPIEVHAGPLKIRGNNYILGFDRDITSRKLSEESDRMYLEQISQLNTELGSKAAELSVANRELESFNYSVSHDMRGPLTRISGYCQLMLEDETNLDPKNTTYLSRIYESSCWLDEMLDAMLKLSQLARADFVPMKVNLSLIVNEAVRELTQAEPDRKVEVIIQPDVEVTGDDQLLKVLICNLISNSWKYSSKKDCTRIEFGITTDALTPVYFVRDCGAGFDMKDADKLFRVFTRLHDPAQFSGSGIGLATVQRVIARHGGRVWADGGLGSGATFFFTLAPEPQSSGQI